MLDHFEIRFRVLLWFALLACCPTLLAQSTSMGNYPPTNAPVLPAGGTNVPGLSSDAIISPDDVVDVYILDVPELSRQYRVSPAGTVLLPLLPEPLQAAGMKTTVFSQMLARQLRDNGLVSNPHVLVSIISSRLQTVAITGAVKWPQIYPVFGKITLIDLISQAGGLNEDAGNQAIITRGDLGFKSGDRTQIAELKKVLDSGDPAKNPELYPGDRVTIPRAGIVYVVGAVNKPGGFPIRSADNGISVLQALALAEDLKSTAVRDKTAIIRVDPKAPGGHKQELLRLSDVLAGKAEDPVLQANDILFVPDSKGAKALHRGLEAIVQMTTGIVVWGRY